MPVTQMLRRCPEERFNMDQIKCHPYFSQLSWEMLLNKTRRDDEGEYVIVRHPKTI